MPGNVQKGFAGRRVAMVETNRERIGRLRNLAERLAAGARETQDPEMRRKMAQAASELGATADALEKANALPRQP
jgi:hypothetical protein